MKGHVPGLEAGGCVKGHVPGLEDPTGSQSTASCFIYLLLAHVLYMKDS